MAKLKALIAGSPLFAGTATGMFGVAEIVLGIVRAIFGFLGRRS